MPICWAFYFNLFNSEVVFLLKIKFKYKFILWRIGSLLSFDTNGDYGVANEILCMTDLSIIAWEKRENSGQNIGALPSGKTTRFTGMIQAVVTKAS